MSSSNMNPRVEVKNRNVQGEEVRGKMEIMRTSMSFEDIVAVAERELANHSPFQVEVDQITSTNTDNAMRLESSRYNVEVFDRGNSIEVSGLMPLLTFDNIEMAVKNQTAPSRQSTDEEVSERLSRGEQMQVGEENSANGSYNGGDKVEMTEHRDFRDDVAAKMTLYEDGSMEVEREGQTEMLQTKAAFFVTSGSVNAESARAAYSLGLSYYEDDARMSESDINRILSLIEGDIKDNVDMM